MRMNRGTILLLAALLIVIVAVLVVNNRQASAPGETATPNGVSGPLLPFTDASTITQYEAIDTASGRFASVTKDAGGAWHIDASAALADRVPDQSLITTTAGQLVAVRYTNTFTNDASTTPLSTFGLDSPSLTIQVTTNDNKLYTIYIGSKSPTSSSYYAVVAAPSTVSTEQPGAASTAEATAMATPEATAQATAEATAESTAAVTPEATTNVVPNAAVTLTGQQTIYLVPQSVIDTLKNWITSPPYAPLPTATPTLLPTVAVTAEATSASTAEATAMSTPEAAMTAESTVPATAEATTAP
jgi:Domain of unknown function (DUF4340)